MTTLDARLGALFESDPGAMADPYSLFEEVREQGPAYPFENAVLLTRYADVRTILQDNGVRFSRAGVIRGRRMREAREQLSPEHQAAFDRVFSFEGLQVVRNDDPEHDRLRKIAHRAFTPKRIAEMRADVERYTDELLEPLVGEEEVDLTELAYTLPLMLISDMLGVPQSDRELIHEWSEKIGLNKGGTIRPEPLMGADRAIESFRAYVREMLEERRRSQAGLSELVATLIDAEEAEYLSTDELTAMFVVLLFGGHETTTNLIGNGLVEMLRRREQWEWLCADPRRSAQATEELLRFVTPVQWQSRTVWQDQEIGGASVEKGDTVIAVIAAANRDPDTFEAPQALDLARPDAKRHLALGFGPHFCLGASLARLEGTVAFGTLARRFPEIELTEDPDALEWRGTSLLRGLARLPVRLGTDRDPPHWKRGG